MFNPQMTSSQMELLPLVCLCLLSWSGTTSAQHERVVVEEGSDAILKCSIDGSNIETAAFEWKKDGHTEVFSFDSGHHHNNGRTGQAEQFKGRVSHFQDELKHGNASIKITNTKVDDSGDYTCEFPNIQPSPTFHVKLFVGAAPEPFVTILDETETSALLQCEAHGVPDLEVHWQDSAGNKLTAEESQVTKRGLSYITLKTTVTKTDRFSCVATQKIINHTVSAEIYVSLPERVVVKQDDDVILPCSIGSNIESVQFDWKKDGQTKKEVFLYNNGDAYRNGRDGQAEQFKGRVSHFQDALKHGNASIKITKMTMDDGGDYTCIFPNLQPPQTFHVKLVVGAAPKPSVTTLDQTDNWALLQCEAHGVPDLEVHWQDSDGNILPAEKSQVTERGLSYITLKTTVTKTDNFSCVATQKNLGHTISTGIYVHLTEPVLKDRTVVVKQDDDVILPCSIGSNIEQKLFDWKKDGQTEVFLYAAGSHYNNGRTGQDEQFKGRVSHFKDELKHGNASIKITNTKMTDSGDYTCKFPNNHPSPTFHVKLVVGAASEPYVTIRKTQGGVLLQCEVHGYPKPKVEWKDSSGNILPAKEPQVTERGGSYDIILRAPVTKTDNFHCVVTQEEINHQISAETYAQTSEDKPQISHSAFIGLVVAAVLGPLLVVLGVVLLVVLIAKGRIVLNLRKDEKQPEEKPKNQQNSEKQAEKIPMNQQNSEKQSDQEV